MLILALLGALLINTSPVFGGEEESSEGLLNQLLAPGPLIEGHKDLEGSKCLACHSPNGGIPNAKCLSCHDAINKQIKLKSGYHGLMAKTCVECHADHRGRSQDIALFDPKKFRHDLTGFKLVGKHADIKCADCHIEKRAKNTKVADVLRPNEPRYIGAKAKCAACHKKDDVHFFQGEWAQADCNACHQLGSWKKEIRFSHEGDAHYHLEGKHAQISCAECHVPKKGLPSIYHWENLKDSKCVACHKDYHLFGEFQSSRLGKLSDCSICHQETSWKEPSHFDHNRSTRFPIAGKHVSVDCNKCHVRKNHDSRVRQYHWPLLTEKTCENCHQSPHTKIFSPELLKMQCATCHTDKGWKITPEKGGGFDHSKTRFALTGKHSELSCRECHRVEKKEVYKFPSVSKAFCIDCHQNPHVGQFHSETTDQACAVCHTTETFTKRLPFDHSKTSYRLLGKHLDLECEKCHLPTQSVYTTVPHHAKMKYLFPEISTQDCASCHKDVHEGNYGKNCSICHNESGWKEGSADFHKNSSLTGVHYALRCNECHIRNVKLTGMSQMCISCHQKDDIHHASLPDCAQCHQQNFWENPEFRHSLTNFPLRGAHRTLDCSACHANTIYKGTPSACSNCHLKDALSFVGNPNHLLLVGRSCSECHSEFSFH